MSVEALAEATNDLVFQIDEAGGYRWANARHSQLLGLTPGELIGTSFSERVHQADLGPLENGLRGEAAQGVGFRLRAADGRWLRLVVVAALSCESDAGAHETMLVARCEAADEASLDGALRDSEDLFRGVLEQVEHSVIVFDVEQRKPIYFNPGFGRIFQMEPGGSRARADEFVSRIHPEDRANVLRWMREQFERPTDQAYRFFLADGALRWIRGATFLIRASDGRIIRMVGIARDVTDEREALIALQEREQRFLLVAEHTRDVVYLLSVEGDPKYLYLSNSIEELTGYSVEYLRSREVGSIDLVHPSDIASYRAEMAKALREHRPILLLYRLLHADGSWRWVEQRGQGVWDNEGRLRFLGGVVLDVSERMNGEQERRALKEQLFQAQKLESLGLLAGGVAHDFNNIMGAVMASVELALMQVEPEHPAREFFEGSLEAAREASALTKQLLASVGQGTSETTPIDIVEPLRDICRLLERSLPENLRLELECVDTLPLVEIGSAQIQQVVMNLVINAKEAIGSDTGLVRVSCQEVCISAQRTRQILGLEIEEAARYVSLSVEDNGGGMSPEVQGKIFDPFFTTKETGHGLGLAAVLGIVRAHRGGIELENEYGRGSRFVVHLPLAVSEESALESGGEQALRGRGCVLVVDDEKMIRETACKVLEHYGYLTFQAANGRQALDIVSQKPEHIDLVLLDLIMPGLSGHEVFRLIRQLRPDLPIVFSSAFGDVEAIARLTRAHSTSFLAKPYGARDLARSVKAALV